MNQSEREQAIVALANDRVLAHRAMQPDLFPAIGKRGPYRQWGDGRDMEKKRAYDREYGKKHKDRIRDRALSRPKAAGAPSTHLCPRCKIEKPFTAEFFVYRPGNKFKLAMCECRKCGNERSLNWQNKKRYGMTTKEAIEFRKKKCEICGSNKNIDIDHCHNKNKVRGALCQTCNKGLGLFYDDVKLLSAAIVYVEKGK